MLFNRSTTLTPIVAMTALLLLTAAKGEGCTISVDGLEEQAQDAIDDFENEQTDEAEICPPGTHLEEICEEELGGEDYYGTPGDEAEEPPLPGGEDGEPPLPADDAEDPGDEYAPTEEDAVGMCYEECVPDEPFDDEDEFGEPDDEGSLEDDCGDHADAPHGPPDDGDEDGEDDEGL